MTTEQGKGAGKGAWWALKIYVPDYRIIFYQVRVTAEIRIISTHSTGGKLS